MRPPFTCLVACLSVDLTKKGDHRYLGRSSEIVASIPLEGTRDNDYTYCTPGPRDQVLLCSSKGKFPESQPPPSQSDAQCAGSCVIQAREAHRMPGSYTPRCGPHEVFDKVRSLDHRYRRLRDVSRGASKPHSRILGEIHYSTCVHIA